MAGKGRQAMDEEIILPSDARAAWQATVYGWVSRSGTFFGQGHGAEYRARYDGSTHGICTDCGNPCPKNRLICAPCATVREAAAYATLPRRVWDGDSPVYSETEDRYFITMEAAEEWIADRELTQGLPVGSVPLESLCLLICTPNYASTLDADYWYDQLPDEAEGEVPDRLHAAIDLLNGVIETLPPLSFSPGKYAVDVEAYRARA